MTENNIKRRATEEQEMMALTSFKRKREFFSIYYFTNLGTQTKKTMSKTYKATLYRDVTKLRSF